MTEEKLAELKALLGTKTVKDLALHFGVTESKIRWQIRKYNLSNPVPWTRSLREVKSISLHASRYGVTSASRKFGITRSTVKNVTKRYRDNRLKYVRGMSPEDLNNKRKQAVGLAWKNGYGNYAEDFGSYVMIAMLSRGNANLVFLWPDFLRETFGNSRTKYGRLQQQATRKGVDVDDPAVLQLKSEATFDTQAEFQDIFKAAGIAQNLRAVFLLSYMWEFDPFELAFLFDASLEEIRSQVNLIEESLVGHIEEEKLSDA